MACERCNDEQKKDCRRHGPFGTEECATGLGMVFGLPVPAPSEFSSEAMKLLKENEVQIEN